MIFSNVWSNENVHRPKLMIKARQRIEKMKKLEFIRQHAEEIICDAIYVMFIKA